MWSYMLSLPRVTRNSTDITTEKATVPTTTNVKPLVAIASMALRIEPLSGAHADRRAGGAVHPPIVADRLRLRYPAAARLTDQSIYHRASPLGGARENGRIHAHQRAEGTARDGARLRRQRDPPGRLGVRQRRHLAAGHHSEGLGGRPDEQPHRGGVRRGGRLLPRRLPDRGGALLGLLGDPDLARLQRPGDRADRARRLRGGQEEVPRDAHRIP